MQSITCHVARRTFATLAISKGVSMEATSKMLDHTNLHTTRINTAITDEKMLRDMDWLAGKLDKLNGAFRRAEEQTKSTTDKQSADSTLSTALYIQMLLLVCLDV